MMTEKLDIARSINMAPRYLSYLYSVIVLILVHLYFFAGLAAAQSVDESHPLIRLETDEGTGPINAHMSFYLEKGGVLNIEDIRTLSETQAFKPVETIVPDFGYYEEGIWLKASLHNLTQSTLSKRLVLHTNFMPETDVYFVTEAGAEHVLSQNPRSNFSSRPVQFHQLVAPFELDAGAKGDVYVRYRSEGETLLGVSLETPLSFAQRINGRVIVDFVFYGIMSMFVIFSLVGRLFWRNPTFISYALYSASVLLYLFQRDGYAFQYLWPNAPVWNNFSSLPIGAALPFFAAFFTRAYLNSNKLHPVIDKVLIAIVVMQISVVTSALFVGGSSAKQFAVLTTTASILIYFFIGVAAYLKYGRRTLFFVVGWLGILFASITVTLVHWSGLNLSRTQTLDIMRLAMVFDAFMLGLASLVSIVEIHRDREKLAQEQMEALNTNLAMHTRLGKLEKKYDLMQSLAERASQHVEDTKHDLRQPLYALRAALTDLSTDNASQKSAQEIEESLTYIEGIVAAELEDRLEAGEVPEPSGENGAEIIRVDKVFSSLQTMFKAEAKKNSIELKIMPSAQDIYAPAFPVLRILANFLSNAVRYAPNARITVGARRRGDKLSLEIHDTGPGMDDAQLQSVKERYERGAAMDSGEASDPGMGLGLSIVDKMVKDNGLEWTITSRKSCGTVAKLIVPMADP